jgi:hypothetical protein
MTVLCLQKTPFDNFEWFHGLRDGMTITEVLRHVRAPRQVWTHGRATVGGVPVPRGWWGRVRVKPAAQLSVTVVPKGGGGGGGGKDIITTIGTLALIAGAAFVSAGALAPVFGAAFAAGTFGAQAAALGFTVVGQLALNALAPPPVAPNVDNNASFAAREIAGVTGNPLGRREYLPRVLGTMRASPPHVMWPYTELVDGEVVANAMFGLAGQHEIADIRLAGAPVEDFDGVTIQTRQGIDDDSLVDLFGYGSAVEQSVSEALTEWQLQAADGQTDWTVDQVTPSNSYPKWKSFKTRGQADRVDMRLFWPSGILFNNTNAGAQMMVFQFRLAGSSTWLNGPELWWSDRHASSQQQRQHVRLIWEEAPLGLVSQNNDTWAWAAYGDTPESFQWKPESYFAPASGYYAENVGISEDGFVVYLDPAIYPKGQYEVRIKRGLQISRNSWTVATYSWSGGTARWYDTISTSAPWLATNNQDDQAGPVILETFLTRSDEYPINQKNLTLIAVRAVGVRIDQLSALFTSIVPARDKLIYNFDTTVENWTVSGATNTVSNSILTHTGNGADPLMVSPAGLNLDGAKFDRIRVRIRRTAGSAWDGFVFWDVGSGLNFSKNVQIAEPDGLSDGFVIAEWDMTDTTGTGADWSGSQIERFQIQFGGGSSDAFEIDYIAVGVADASDWQVLPTKNPAALYRHVLTSKLNTRPLPQSAIDDVELGDWYEQCLDRGYECNAVIQNYSVDQTKQLIAAAGWALPQQGNLWGVIQERDLSAVGPTQTFTQRNTRGLTVEKAFADVPHAIVGEFFDQTDDYRPTEAVVYLPGYSALNATEFEVLRYDGITALDKVRDRIGLDIGQLLYRQQKYTFEADMAHLVSPRGSLVALSNDMLSQIYDSSRIWAVYNDGAGNITRLALDSTVTIKAVPKPFFAITDFFAETDVFGDSADSGIVVQKSDGTTVTLAIDETSDTDTVTLTTPLADDGTIVPSQLVCVGPLSREVRRCRILSIERVQDLMARITLVDEAPQLHTA